MRTPHNERLTPDTAEDANARSDSGREEAHLKQAAERRCILSREGKPRDGMIRLALSPDGDVLPDIRAKAPGRGAWIGVDAASLQDAMDKGRLQAALKHAFKGAPVQIPDDLPERIHKALLRNFSDRLGLELRFGRLVMGTESIGKSARKGKVWMLLHASDASEDGRRKLDQAWRVGSDAEGSGKRGKVLPLDREALSVAMGRDNVVHLALVDKSSAGRVEQALGLLLGFVGEFDARVEN